MAEKARTNTKSVISLTLGILSIVIPTIGIVLGIIGLVISRIGIREIENSNENGRGIATSGFICSIIGISINLLWILLGIWLFYSYSNPQQHIYQVHFISLFR